jgi:hypothetical protein
MIRALTFCLIACIAVVLPANESTRSESTGREVLSRQVGSWDVRFDADDPFSAGTLNGQWVLGGAYLEQTGEFTARFVPSDVTIKTLTKYDEGDQQFKRWSFLSNGRELLSIGTWEPGTNTMTWVTEKYEPLSKRTVVVTSTEEFRADGTVIVSKVSKNADGEIGRSSELRTPRK